MLIFLFSLLFFFSLLQRSFDRFKQVKSLMKQLFEALAAVHRAGWVHRDVKMTNILLTESGTLKLVDFGQARPIAQQQEGKAEEPEEEAAVQGFGTDSERPPTPGVIHMYKHSCLPTLDRNSDAIPLSFHVYFIYVRHMNKQITRFIN